MRMRLLAVAGFVMASTLAAAPAGAQQYPPAGNIVTLSDTTLVAGQPLTMTAGGFLDGATVTFTFASDPVTLGTATADVNGLATLTASIPGNASPGQHTITASGDSVNGPLTVSATVTVAGGAADPATANAAELPPTGLGGGTVAAAVVAVIVLVLGGVLLLLARRRRYADT